MNQDANVNNEIFRKDHAIILSTNRHLATILPVRLENTGDDYLAGTVLARRTSGANTGLFTPYDDGGASGAATASCILFQDVKAEEFTQGTGTAVARGIFGGKVFYDKLIGIDANGITDLGARLIIDASSTEILKF